MNGLHVVSHLLADTLADTWRAVAYLWWLYTGWEEST